MTVELLQESLNEKMAQGNFIGMDKKVIILDDDPTGTQTVYDLPIYTEVDYEKMENIFNDKNINAFYILTNTRSMSEDKVVEIDSCIAKTIEIASKRTGVDYELIIRGDSTLRGHFPLEVDILKNNISKEIEGYFLIPFFEEGGRITADDIHYVKENDKLIPVGNTYYAADHTFGFKSSNLKEYIEEKTKGLISKNDVVSISLQEIRNKEVTLILDKIMHLNGRYCIVNAENYEDIKTFVDILLIAEGRGKNYLFRTSASFVKARIGLGEKSLLDGRDLNINSSIGGVIVAGSYVNKTTEQIKHLIENTKVESLEINVADVLSESDNEKLIYSISKKIDNNIILGVDTLIYTSRIVVFGDENYTSLEIGNKISCFLTRIIKELKETPSFILAKGGITSSDIATKGLNVKKAIVCGQVAKGVPVWKCGLGSKYKGLVYIVFPGNVGDEDELTNVINRLHIS